MSCGTGPDATAEEGEVLMPRRRKIVDKSICGRCRDAKALYAVRNTTFCRACFLESVTQRFIRGLYSSIHIAASPVDAPRTRKFPAGRPHPRAGQVVVALSGGAGSMAMLDNLHAAEHIGQGDGKRADKTKGERDPIWDSGTAVYVEFAGVTGMADRREEMERMVKRKGLDFVAVRAEEVFDDALPMRFGGERQVGGLAVDLAHADLQFTQPSSSTPTSHLDKLKALLSSLPAASRPAVLSNILSAILNLAARTLPNVSHILIGETSTREAQRVISGAAGGRGWSIPLELQPALPAGDREVFRLKPMKELAVKEVAIYCHLKGVKTINERKWAGDREAGKGKGKAPSLEMLTEHFIAGLSVTHPSTVSTIIKTGDKLVFPGEVMGETCPMCQLPVDASAKAWKQRTALTRLEKTPTTDPAADGQAVSSAGLADMLCYACLTTFTPTTHTRSAAVDPVELPHWVGSRVLKSKRVEQAEMRQEIESFLL